jgi:hypothetical protein
MDLFDGHVENSSERRGGFRTRKKPPRVEAALACRLTWSDHMPKCPASGMESGIIMIETKIGTMLIMGC